MDRRQPTGKAEIVQRQEVSGPATRWLPGDNIQFPIERLAGGDVGQVGGVPVDLALYQPAGSEEYATPVSRAKGQLIRLLPFTAVWLILAVGVVWLLGLTWPWLLLWFGIATAFTYWRMNRDEFEFSRNGLERHRVNAAADLKEKELDQTHELKKMALTTYLEIARAHYLGVQDDNKSA